MVIDSSALLAILFGEPEAQAFSQLIFDSETRLLSAVNHFEAAIVADAASNRRRGPTIDDLLAALAVEIIPVTKDESHTARVAYQRFGKGNHRAKLNMGDCFAYGLAKTRGLPLLYKGNDFDLTDVQRAVP